MMQRIENIIIAITFGAIPVIACFLAGWWLSIPFVNESYIFLFALGGILLGIIIDLVFLKIWIRSAYFMKLRIWILIYIFYSIMVFGFFMGFPIFNLFLAIPAGIFIARRLVYNNADPARIEKAKRKSALFTTSVLGVVCTLSVLIALLNDSTGSDIKGMLRLPFEVTITMITGIILVGGTIILILEWWLTINSIKFGYRYFYRTKN